MDLVEAKEEEELFKTRLLNIEEKPFKRITKRLATLHRVVAANVRQEQTPPPEGGGAEGGGGGGDDDDAKEGADTAEDAGADTVAATAPAAAREAGRQVLAQLREDATLDFAAFDASIARLRFLGAANVAERVRYAADRGTVAAKGDAVRADMVRLRAQLADARATLAVRREFDALADRITQSRTLLPRPDQQATIAKLEDECRQLQAESAAYTATWRERKEQFARIMDESMRLRRLIRDEKEEVERRAGMDEEEDGPVAGGAGTPAPTALAASRATAAAGTPGPGTPGGGDTEHTSQAATKNDGRATRWATPQPEAAASAAPAQTDADDGLLKPGTPAANASSRAGSRAASRAASREATPAAHTPAANTTTIDPADDMQDGDDTDVDMVEMVGMPQLADEEDTMDTT